MIVQGGIEITRSKESGRLYATSKTASLVSSFPKEFCKTLIGKEIPGTVKRVQCEPFEVANPETGEIVLKDYRYEYVVEDDLEEPEPVLPETQETTY